jgi:hypothetical protein
MNFTGRERISYLDTRLEVIGHIIELEVLTLGLKKIIGSDVTAFLEWQLRVHEDHRTCTDTRYLTTDQQ